MTPDRDLPGNDVVRTRQRGRATVMAVLLAGFAVLVFFITISKIRHGGG